jgi:CubicO group peptidase (beta-lactamase class C family)
MSEPALGDSLSPCMEKVLLLYHNKSMKTNFSEQIKQVGRIVDSWLPLKIKYDHTPGISVGIVYKGKLSYKKGFGFADVEKKQRANEKTLYHIASISKTFTAVSIMQLVEKGKLRLDDKVISYVPWFKAKGESGDTKYVYSAVAISYGRSFS